MHRALALLFSWSALIAGDLGTLQRLTDQSRFFELRRDLDRSDWDGADVLWYRAFLACRFGHETEGIGLIKQALSLKTAPRMARKAHEEMAAAYARQYNYREAARAWDQALSLTPAHDPEREGNENSRALMDALSDTPPETAELAEESRVQASRNPLGSWNVPVEVNGVNAQWIFDTGANVSTVTETEAKRMGLSVRETKVYVSGSTQKKNAIRLAVASDVHLGSARIRNVVFLVINDAALHVVPLHYQITGILGLPVIRVLRRVAVSNDGTIKIEAGNREPAGMPNLFFDGASPIVEGDHSQHHLQMLLDTGANASVLYGSALGAMGRDERVKLRRKREKVGGAGGVITRKTQFVPSLEMEIHGLPVILKNLSLTSENQEGNRRFRDGVIGMDALWSGFRLDFVAMTLQLQ